MKAAIKRIGVLMPQYPPINTKQTGKVKTTPHPWWRRLFPWVPYFVGGRVVCKIELERNPERFILYEKFGDIVYETFEMIPGRMLRGSVIPRECDIEYILAPAGQAGFTAANSVTIITATVTNSDRWSLGCAGLVVGAILTLATSILLGLLDIQKFWRIWIP